jgi:hypothetical protein
VDFLPGVVIAPSDRTSWVVILSNEHIDRSCGGMKETLLAIDARLEKGEG